MSAGVRQGFLLLADVTGYTSFMADNELEHAQEVMGSVLNLLVGELTPALELVEIEGDAVFVYGPRRPFPRSETLVELIEATYLRFRERLLEMQRDTTCPCRACRAIPALDLKFVLHHGEFALQSVAGKEKPVGSDVTLAHRLLKNGVSEATGCPAYVLFSETSISELGVETQGLHEGKESYEHLGDVRTFALDLARRHSELVCEQRVSVSADEAQVVRRLELAAPPAVVWAWLNEPEFRSRWLAGTTWTRGARPGGRTGIGSENHCAHSTGTALERIVAWHPLESYTTETRQGPLRVRQTYELRSTAAGTALEVRSKLETSLPGALEHLLARLFFRIAGQRRALERLAELVGADA